MADPSLRDRVQPVLAGVRFRTALVAVLVVGVVLALAVVVVGVAARARLEASITAAVETRADDVAALVEAGGAQGVLAGRAEDLFAQVVGGDGSVVAFSPGLGGLGPLVSDRPAPGEARVFRRDEVFEDAAGDESDDVEYLDDGPYVIVVRGVAASDGVATVVAGGSLSPAHRAVGVLRPLAWAGLPVVLAIVGALVWYLAGRALRPVDAMRAEAASISAAVLDRRLPEPDSRDEVHSLATTLNEMLDRLEGAAVRQRRFVADASHELKTPVAAIRTMLEVAEREPGFSDWGRLVTDLTRENLRSEDLVHDLLALAAFDEGAVHPRRVEIDLDQLVGAEAEAVRHRAEVRVDASALQPARVWGDPDALTRLVRNVIDNAERHADTMVWAATRVEGGTAVIEVSDDGPGIAQADRERVFERFVRLDEARSRAGGGTGLGLSVVRAVARSHGGDVAVIDPRHGGTTIEARIPVGVGTPEPR